MVVWSTASKNGSWILFISLILSILQLSQARNPRPNQGTNGVAYKKGTNPDGSTKLIMVYPNRGFDTWDDVLCSTKTIDCFFYTAMGMRWAADIITNSDDMVSYKIVKKFTITPRRWLQTEGESKNALVDSDESSESVGEMESDTSEKCCSANACGEPHFKKWMGGWFDYQGECDLVMLNAPDFGFGLGLDIHLRTKIRYDYSFIESAAIKIGEDVLEVSSFGQYHLNGVSDADLRAMTVSGLSVTQIENSELHNAFVIDAGHRNSIEIRTLKDIVSVSIKHSVDSVALSWFGNSTGMMGSFEGGDMLARDGITILPDPNVFGQEWMVLDSEPKLFQNIDRAPQYPSKCALPSEEAKEKRRRLGGGVSRVDAEEACAHHGERVKAKEICVADVIAMNDLDMAGQIIH